LRRPVVQAPEALRRRQRPRLVPAPLGRAGRPPRLSRRAAGLLRLRLLLPVRARQRAGPAAPPDRGAAGGVPGRAPLLRGAHPLLLLRSQILASPATTDPLEEQFRQALLADPADEASWRAYSDWLQERGERPAGLVVLERALQAVTHFPVADPPDSTWDFVRF